MDEQKIQSVLDYLNENPPLIHAEGAQTWSINADILRFLAKNLKQNAQVVETGMGLSTIFFSALDVHHTAIGPDPEEVTRIREYCAAHDISLEKTTFIVKSSTDTVWDLGDQRFDLIVIDGHHGFPVPMIDWFYLCSKLNAEGIVAVDDVQIWTGAVLADFMEADPQWIRLWRKLYSKTVVYQCENGFELRRKDFQPYVLKKSWLLRLKYVVCRSGWYLLRGEFGRLWQGLITERRPDYHRRKGLSN